MISTATVIETARVEQLVQGDHEYDRDWETVGRPFAVGRRSIPNVLLSEWLHERQPATGTYRLVTSWGARSDEIVYRAGA